MSTLGFIRQHSKLSWDYVDSDRLTADNDYIIPSEDVLNVMVLLLNNTTTGLAHIWQNINRMFITADFANGELQKWNIPA